MPSAGQTHQPGVRTPLERFLQHAELEPAARRLTSLGQQWARDRGADWSTVLNDGPVPASGPSWPFRWVVVVRMLESAAGLGTPLADFDALPLELQSFLALAVPAALHPTPAVEPHMPTAVRVLADAERLAEELVTAEGPWRRPEPIPAPAPPSSPLDDTTALLRAALQPSSQPTQIPGLDALRTALTRGPVSVRDARQLAAAHGVLLGTLLDALERASLRDTGRPATRVESGVIYPAHPADAGAAIGRTPADA